MSLTEKEVIKISKLARIAVSPEEIPHFSKELSRILSIATSLNQVPTDNVPQMTSVLGDMVLPKRKDEVTDGNRQGDVLANAPAQEFGCFVVPKVIE